MIKHAKLHPNQEGFLMPILVSLIIAITILGGAVLEVILTNLSTVDNNLQSQKAFNIAEAGINYYQWHLSHNPTDYQDGQNAPTTQDPVLGYGPYIHNYVDANAVKEGTYTLWIKPPGNGTSYTTVRSIGQITNTKIIRTVQAQLGKTSFANYGVLSDSALWFGSNETANGPVFSNQGIRMDGPNTAQVVNANATYVPSFQLGGDGNSHPGVWCNTSIVTPVNCSTRNKNSWDYPTSNIDFNQVTSTLCSIKTLAFASNSATSSLANQANACSQTPNTRTPAYIPEVSQSFSNSRGYLIQLNADGTYNLSQVTAENDLNSSYNTALTTTSIANNISPVSSGVIFVEDNVWVRTNPSFHGRITIASGRLADSSSTNIVIADNLLYSTKNGSDAIGLMAENSVLIAPYAPPLTGSFNYEVDAAILAQSGNVMYPDTYRSNTNRCTHGWVNNNQNFTFYGSVAVRQIWTWSWLNGGSQCGDAGYDPVQGYISGFDYNSTQYDYNLLYNPPPSWPVTGSWSILSWREVLTHP